MSEVSLQTLEQVQTGLAAVELQLERLNKLKGPHNPYFNSALNKIEAANITIDLVKLGGTAYTAEQFEGMVRDIAEQVVQGLVEGVSIKGFALFGATIGSKWGDHAGALGGVFGGIIGLGASIYLNNGGADDVVDNVTDWMVEKILDGEVPGADEIRDKALQEAIDRDGSSKRHCFAAGTAIAMADGSQRPIEFIKGGDEVLAYDPSEPAGPLAARRVVRLFVTENAEVIDFHGLTVTPGHMFLTPDHGFMRLDEILELDGAIIDEAGRPLRARTLAPVGSDDDAVVPVAVVCERGEIEVVRVRAGVPFARRQDDGSVHSLSNALSAHGLRRQPGGLVESEDGEVRMLRWIGPDPRLAPHCHAFLVGPRASASATSHLQT